MIFIAEAMLCWRKGRELVLKLEMEMRLVVIIIVVVGIDCYLLPWYFALVPPNPNPGIPPPLANSST